MHSTELMKSWEDQSNDKEYEKPIRTKIVFNGNYIEYENKGDKDKNYHLKNMLILSGDI